jgi:hypothetical protein
MFSCFARSDWISTVLRASGPVFIFCGSGIVFGGTEGVRSCFHVSRVRIPFSCFARLDWFSTVPRASCLVFMSCAPAIDFGGNEHVGSRFLVLRSWTRFWRYRGRRVPFSCFTRPDLCSAVSSESGPFFMFCAPELVFGGTEGVGSRFHVL